MAIKNVGIVGSSFSSGNINLAKNAKSIDWENYSDDDYIMSDGKYHKTRPLVDVLKTYSEYNFYSLAEPGFGSEKYLSDVIYLKNKYDIDILLIEFIENRSSRYHYSNSDHYSNIVDNNLHEFMDMYKESFGEQNIFKRIKGKEWNQFLNDVNTPKTILFFTLHDIIQTMNLCKIANIIPIIWCYCFWIGSSWNSKVDNFLKLYDDDVIKFDKSYTALEYFYKKYNGNEKDFLCDGCHLNDNGNIDLVQNFLLPRINEKKT